MEPKFLTHAHDQAAAACGMPSALLHIALGPCGRITLLTAFLATFAVTLRTDIRNLTPTCMLAMHNVTLALTAVLTGFLVAVVSTCGWHAVHAGDLVYAFTLLSALQVLSQRARMHSRQVANGCLGQPNLPAPECIPGSVPHAGLLASPSTSTIRSTAENTYPLSNSDPPATANIGVARPVEAPPATFHVPLPVRHSVDGCLLLPQPRRLHYDPAEAAAESAVAPRAPAHMQTISQQAPCRSTGSLELAQQAVSSIGDAGPPSYAVHAGHAGAQHVTQFDPLMQRWSLDEPPLRWPAPSNGAAQRTAWGDGPAAADVATGVPAPGWFEALAANALVLDSLEPMNPKCESAHTQLRGIGLHACNPLMHELQRRPSSTAADALQRFGLPRDRAASPVPAAMGAALRKVPEEMPPFGAAHAPALRASALPPGALGERDAGRTIHVCMCMHGIHACVQTIFTASVAVVWQGMAVWFWLWLGRKGLCDDGGAAAPPAALAHSMHAWDAAPEALMGQGNCGGGPPEAAAAFVFFLFLKVHALGWMRVAQVARYTASFTANAYTLACAVLTLRSILHMHGLHASLPGDPGARPPGPPASFGDVNEPLLSRTFSSSSSSSTSQHSTPGCAAGERAAQSRLFAPLQAPARGLEADKKQAGLASWGLWPEAGGGCDGAPDHAHKSAAAAERWRYHLPSIELLPGRPKAHAYCTLPTSGSKLHAYRPPEVPVLHAELAQRPLVEAPPPPAHPRPLAAVPRSAQITSARDTADMSVRGSHALQGHGPRLPWLPEWGYWVMRLGRGCPRVAQRLFYMAFFAVGCVHVWAAHQVAVWNGVPRGA